MDKNRILELLKNTQNPDPAIREPAETNLNAIHKIIGFTPALLELALDQDLEHHLKQAAVIYLKNNVMKYWDATQMVQDGQIDPSVFVIHEHDKKIISDSIVDSLVRCNHNQLVTHISSIVHIIIKADFPHKWPGVIDKIHYYLAQHNDYNAWNGALITFYQLAKIYEYKNVNDRKAFIEALKVLLPTACQRLAQLLQNDPLSEQSCQLQKQILKTFHAILQYSLPMGILTRDVFEQWMNIIIEIANRDVPEEVQKDVLADDRPDLVWWKCKKWSLHLMARIFERYGSPNSVSREYKSFAEWYIQRFSVPVIRTILKILEQYALGQYVSPRVLQQALNYLNTAVLHSMTWKMLKNDMMVVVEKIIFPLMCHSNEDEELWHEDPREYIRMKFDIFEEYVSPVSASQNLLHNLCKKRRDMLQKTMTLVMNVLNNPTADPKAKDGALHMIGSISSVLLKKPLYKDQLEQLLVSYVFPLFSCSTGFLRTRACWALSYFSGIEFKNPNNIMMATQAVIQCILADQELPVKVEAALSLQNLLNTQEEARKIARQNVKLLALELVNVIRNTESEDVMEVLQKIVYIYPDEIYPIAVDMTNHLARTFHQSIEGGDTDEEDKITAAMAIISTIDSILTMVDEQKEIVANLEPIVIQVILTIFDRSMSDLYEEATTLLSTITSDAVSQGCWRVFQTLYHVFNRDGADYFTDMMSPIHNYITVDPQTFLSNRSNIGAVFEMCRTIMTDNSGDEERETYAAKLLEIVILQFRNQIDDCIPSFIELAITRLRREITSSDLRTLLIQIVTATFYCNYQLLFSIFENMEQQSNQPRYTLFDSFIKQWLKDIEALSGLHDRKMSIIGFCTLILLPADKRPPIVTQISNQIIPSVLTLYERLKIAYQKKATADSDSETDDDDEEDDSDNEAEVLEDDQDHVDIHADDDDELDNAIDNELSDNDDFDEEILDDSYDLTALESFETIIDTPHGFVDEFLLFRDTMENVRQNDPNWYQMLLAPLDATQQKRLMDLGEYVVKRQGEAAQNAAALAAAAAAAANTAAPAPAV